MPVAAGAARLVLGCASRHVSELPHFALDTSCQWLPLDTSCQWQCPEASMPCWHELSDKQLSQTPTRPAAHGPSHMCCAVSNIDMMLAQLMGGTDQPSLCCAVSGGGSAPAEQLRRKHGQCTQQRLVPTSILVQLPKEPAWAVCLCACCANVNGAQITQ